jgi:superfamily I DNA/RNA helicase
MKVNAGAGSGKTTTMAHFVNLQIQKHNIQPQNISFITFTRFAAQEIKNKVKKVIGRNVPILTGTFHSTMFRLLRMANIITPDATYLYDGRMEENVKFFMSCLETEDKRLLSVLRTFKILVVDEFQDLDLTQFKFVQYFKKFQPTLPIVAIGDLAQNIEP